MDQITANRVQMFINAKGKAIYDELMNHPKSAAAFALATPQARSEAVAWTWLHRQLIGMGLTQDEATTHRKRFMRVKNSKMHAAIAACFNAALNAGQQDDLED